MGFTKQFLLEMGFKEIAPENPITATFQSVNIYHINGIDLSKYTNHTVHNAGNGVTFAIGNDIDQLCIALVNDKWLDTEEEHEKWRESNKANPPYLLAVTQRQTPVTAETGYWIKNSAQIIETYDSFPTERKNLQQFENETLPPLLIALSSQLSDDQRVASFSHITRHVDAVTNNGDRLRDFTIGFKAELTTSVNKSDVEIDSAIATALTQHTKFSPKAARWLQAGVAEIDSFKKFRCFFLATEILTKDTFAPIKEQCKQSDLLNTRLANCVAKYQHEISSDSRLTHLFVMFLWCSALVWNHITEQDIDLMYKLKRVRDKSMHGDITTDDNYPFHEAHQLATKLFR